MKKPVLKFALLIVVLCISTVSFAQDFQGKAYYMSKTSMDLDQFGGRDMSPERKKQIQERMKSFLEKQYILTFNREESIYKEDEKLEAIGAGGGRGFGGFGSSFTGGPKYKNVKSKEVIQDQEFFGKQFLIKDELKNLEWTMGTETKQIGQYTVFKATATKTITGVDMQSFRPRGRNDRNESEKAKDSTASGDKEEAKADEDAPRTIEVVAWYTPQIPINQGPDDYWGLPGLILEVNADRTTILCTKIVINPEEKEDIDKPKKGQVVTQEEYTDITTKKIEEMREMYGGRGGRGGGGRRN